ncbi:hypothetical protein [Burkholderia cepacia]|uniref:hypothetical protein n=1 Tax=Burkholderia cepacia TaxID=292 RepID=UPI0009C097E4|nr:hypothetical protein [Burkholderia cepacia]
MNSTHRDAGGEAFSLDAMRHASTMTWQAVDAIAGGIRSAFGRNVARRARMYAGPMRAAGAARPGRRQMLIVTGPASGV